MKQKSQLVLHDYLIFHRGGNCPPNHVMANPLTPLHVKNLGEMLSARVAFIMAKISLAKSNLAEIQFI